jgi:hypothetical protein
MRSSQLLRLFPRGWRARYGDEFLATTGDEPLRPRQIVDIAACAVDAWLSVDVRRAARTDPDSGGDLVTKKRWASCGNTAVALSRRDAWLGALAMIGGSILLSIAGIAAKRSGFEMAGEAILSLAFFASLLLTMPFTYLKGKPWRVQLVMVGVPLLILALCGWLATRI